MAMFKLTLLLLLCTACERCAAASHDPTSSRSGNDMLSGSSAAIAVTGATDRLVVPFRYAFRFHYGPGPDDAPGPGACEFPHNIGGMSCTNMEHNPNRFTPDDCRIGCCYEPTCLAWQHDGAKSCLWGGSNSTCTGQPKNNAYGGRRASFQPVKTDYKFAGRDYDDSHWPLLDVPHDALVNGTFTDTTDSHHGYLPRNVSWYRKHFVLPTASISHDESSFSSSSSSSSPSASSPSASSFVWMLEFEGTFHYTQIWVNGVHVMDHSIGYTPYSLRLDTLVTPGQPSVIALRTDSSYGSGHWYEGGGIRWDVRLVRYNKVHIARHGAFIVPQLSTSGPRPAIPASVEVLHEQTRTTLVAKGDQGEKEAGGTGLRRSENDGAAEVYARFTLTQPESGAVVASCTTSSQRSVAATTAINEITPNTNNATTTLLSCALKPNDDLKLWSVRDPYQYNAQCTLFANGVAVDSYSWSTGFRNATFTGASGVFLNGQHLEFRGFSHHDSFAGVGVAMPPRFDLFRAQAGRMLGSNVWRMSHNPYHPELYDVLSALGTTIWDENRDLGPWYAAGMGTMVRRDRNVPAVLLWSFCNEYECGQNSPATGFAFRKATLSQDRSRPTTANVNGNHFITGVDVQGFSHANNNTIRTFHQDHLSVPTVLSECCSCTSHRLPVSVRGPSTSCIRSQNSPGLLPYNTGSLGVWTLFDYFGESHTWPNYACAFGQFDIAGDPKPHAFWYTVNWGQLISEDDAGRPPIPFRGQARLLDLADQLDCDATSCTVNGISTAQVNELFIDGKSAGRLQPSMLGDVVTWKLSVPDHATTDDRSGSSGNCSFPEALNNIQCKGLERVHSAESAEACAAACCADPFCRIYQFEKQKGCWTGPLNPAQACFKPASGWVGGGRNAPPEPQPLNFSTLKLVASDARNQVVATHTLVNTRTRKASQLEGTLDIPSVSTGTGSHLVLDGRDTALVRVTLVDKNGALISTLEEAVNVTFSVVSGPGELVGAVSGDPAAHTYQNGVYAQTFAGTVKAVVRVNVDCTSEGRGMAAKIDAEGGRITTVVPEGVDCTAHTRQPIVLRAETAEHGSVDVKIPVSSQPEVHGVLAVARSTARNLTAYSYIDGFRG